MKISIVYFTSTGRTASMAEEIKKGIAAADASIEVGLFPISEVTSYHEENVNFVNDSAAVIVGTPDYYAAEANQLKPGWTTAPASWPTSSAAHMPLHNFLQRRRRHCHSVRSDPAAGEGHRGLFQRYRSGPALYPSWTHLPQGRRGGGCASVPDLRHPVR